LLALPGIANATESIHLLVNFRFKT
jgi:hypothetical protein